MARLFRSEINLWLGGYAVAFPLLIVDLDGSGSCMQISYNTADLKQCCQRREVAEERFGRTYADRLVSEIADAEAFDNVGEWREFLGGNAVTFADNSFQVIIGSRYITCFISVDENAPFDTAGRIVWAGVEYIKLMSISELQ